MLKSEVAYGLKWQAICIVGKQVFSLVVSTTLARLLEPSAFGLAALASVYLGFNAMFVDQGIGVALIAQRDLKPEHKDAAFWFNMTCASILCVATMAMAGPVSALFNEPRLIPLLRLSSLGLVIGASSAIHVTLFVKALDFRRPVIRTLIANAVGGVGGVAMAVAGCGVWSLVGQGLACEIASAIFLWSMSAYRPAFRLSWSHLRELLGFGWTAFASSMLWFVSTRIDQFIIARFAGAPALGFYTIARKIPSMANTITQQPLLNVSLPSISQLQSDHAEMRKAICRGMELNAVVSFAVFVGLAAVASELVPLLFGAKWAAAAALCSLVSLFSLVEVLQVLFFPILLASGGVGKYLWVNVCQTVGVLVACLVGIRFGVAYLVLGLIANSMVMAIPALFFLRHRIGLSPVDYCKPCIVPAFASLFMVGMVYLAVALLPEATPLMLLLVCKVALGAILYIGFILIFDRAPLIKLLNMVAHAVGFRSALPSVIRSSAVEH